MFSYLLSGRLGEFMAPRPSSNQEIWALLKSGMFEKVLSELRKPKHNIDINALDSATGMAAIHYAAAGGAMELVVELLSQNADIALPSSDGNNALHYAALNERKGIVEILLRSGADPSIPNHSGLLPIELTATEKGDSVVTELFLRDRSNIFSPIASVAQSRILLNEYIRQGGSGDLRHDQLTNTHSSGDGDDGSVSYKQLKQQFDSPIALPSETSADANFSNTATADSAASNTSGSSSKMPVFNMNSEFEGEEGGSSDGRSSGNSPLPELSHPMTIGGRNSMLGRVQQHHTLVGIASPVIVRTKRHGQQHGGGQQDSLSDSQSDEAGDYTIVGVSSVVKPPVFRLDSFPEGDSEPSSPAKGAHKTLGVPMLDLSHLQKLPPPSINNTSTVNTYSAAASQLPQVATRVAPPPTVMVPALLLAPLSARRGSNDSTSGAEGGPFRDSQGSNGSPATSSKYTPVQTQHGMTTPWSESSSAYVFDSSALFTDYNSNNNRNQSHVRRQLSSTPGFSESSEQLRESEELHREVLQAAIETNLSLQSNMDEYNARRLVIRNCQKLNEKQLKQYLTFSPALAMSRASGMGDLARDGQTPLHVAASFGNIETLKILTELGSPETTTVWARDIQGRTPLHIAAEKGKKECCDYLREAMRLERNRDPVGVHAPVDLAGTTPLGWAAFGSRGKPTTGVEKSLFKAGDRSILPLTPHAIRAGKSPWKAALLSGLHHQQRERELSERENLVFAFSEANGWTPMMEDRIEISCPVANHISWSLFSVFDGHGGAHCSSFLAEHVASIFARECEQLVSCTENDSEVQPETFTALLKNVCVTADRELSEQPRMAVEISASGKISCMDSSGSTAVMVLVTPKYVVVSNVGDSRAVLAQRVSSPRGAQPMSGANSPTATRKQFTPEDSLSEIRAATPVNVTTPAASGGGEYANNDHLTASIERLNPNLSTPTTATPQHGHAYSQAAYSPVAYHKGGSSGCALSTVALTFDHKAYLPAEKARAEAAGATVEQVPGSVNTFQMSVKGSDVKLRMSRSFGDFYLKQNAALPFDKQAVIAVPDVVVHTREARDAFVVLACDGIFDVMTNEEVVDFIGEQLGFTAYGGPMGGVSTQLAAEACDALLAECLHRGTVDNISVILVVLGAQHAHSATAHLSAGGVASTNPYQYYNSTTTNISVMNSGGAQSSGHIVAQRRHSGSSNVMRASVSTDTLSAPQRSPRADYTVDMPINSGKASGTGIHSSPQRNTLQPTSLNNAFDNLALAPGGGSSGMTFHRAALEEDDMCMPSPIHNMAGRVRKQLQFDNDS